ncbi:MAG TPA: FkbM family methyltransferase [Thermoleophilaceae bacterium]|nr:FkbM family methyltransferase [Thermoleophilaceae bacterium]
MGTVLERGRGIARELAGARRIAHGGGSFARITADIGLYRALRFGDIPGRDGVRRIRLRDGTVLSYRLNRGDVQGLREVWMGHTYRLPVALEPVETIVDLGANIGLTSVYLARRYKPQRLIAVEPEPENARLANLNLRQNAIAGELIEAAVGPSDGSALFARARESNVGHLGDSGLEVRVMSMKTLLSQLPDNVPIDILKLDIEGGEAALLEGDRGWLARVRVLIAEFHPEQVDYPRLVQLLRDEGFEYVPAGSVHPNSADTFYRAGDARLDPA